MSDYSAPTTDDLREIAEQVWSSYLDPEGVSPLVPVAPGKPAEDVSGAVSVTGAWRGHVVISFSAAASRRAAAALLGVEFEEVSVADVTDAVGELANIIGGNVKSLLPEPAALSLPHVQTGGPGTVHWPAATEVCHLTGSWEGEPVTVSVLESSPDYVGGAQPAVKILIADDSRVMRQIVTRTLRQAGFDGHTLVEAADGREALDATLAHRPDLVLSDWNMPEMTGVEFLRALRAKGVQVPFGFVTSEGTAEMRKAAEAAGALFVITKPFTADAFRDALSPILG